LTRYVFVASLPDLIGPERYALDPAGRQVRLQIRVTDEGVELLGDAMRPVVLERLLEEIGATTIEQMLCG
jgi:hypothetical protein